MTACASPRLATSSAPGGPPSSAADGNERAPRPGCVITADGSYGARLARDGESWFPERWTLDGPEPYAVPLPGNQPEEPGTEVLPMTDGRVLIHRVTDGRHAFSLLYPTGPATGELPLGAVECPDEGTRLRLLPPAPGGERAYALAAGPCSTAVWLVAGGAFGPEHLAEIPGRCSGGVWLDGTERLLALDRESAGRTKTIVVDLERGGEVSPLLQIAEDSNDRLLLADHDSGLLLIRSDAPGQDRLGWGVLGSTLPVRFPESLRLADCSVTPFAIQPGQVLTPESCAVALRIDGAAGTWVGVWRPAERQVHHLPAPEGWLAGSGLWTRDGVLQLPYTTGTVACGVARTAAPVGTPDAGVIGSVSVPVPGPTDSSVPDQPASAEPVVPRPVPLQQAPLAGRPRPARKGPPAPAPVGGEATSTGASAASVATVTGDSVVAPVAPEEVPVSSPVAQPTWVRVTPPTGAVHAERSPVIPVPRPTPVPESTPSALATSTDPVGSPDLTDPPTTRLSPVVPEPVSVGTGAPLLSRTGEAAVSGPEPVVWVAVKRDGVEGAGEEPVVGGEDAVAADQRTVAAG